MTSMLKNLSIQIETCTNCPLHTVRKNYVPDKIPISPKIIILNFIPCPQESWEGKSFVGSNAEIIKNIIIGLGFTDKLNIDDDIAYLHLIKCPSVVGYEDYPSYFTECYFYIKEQLEQLKSKHIIVLGKETLRYLMGQVNYSNAEKAVFEFPSDKDFNKAVNKIVPVKLIDYDGNIYKTTIYSTCLPEEKEFVHDFAKILEHIYG